MSSKLDQLLTDYKAGKLNEEQFKEQMAELAKPVVKQKAASLKVGEKGGVVVRTGSSGRWGHTFFIPEAVEMVSGPVVVDLINFITNKENQSEFSYKEGTAVESAKDIPAKKVLIESLIKALQAEVKVAKAA